MESVNAILVRDESTSEQLPKLPDDPLKRAQMIRKLRVARELSQVEFAQIVEIRFSTYTEIEGGVTRRLTPSMLQRIARELGCEV